MFGDLLVFWLVIWKEKFPYGALNFIQAFSQTPYRMKDVFKALADPTRREILLMIAEQPRSINEVADAFEMSRPAVSKHIRILTDCDLVAIRTDQQDGRQRNCYAQLEVMAEVSSYLEKLKAFWENRLDRLGKYLEKRDKPV